MILKLKLLCQFPKMIKIEKNNNQCKGFTLIELLLALTIGSIIVLCLYSMLNFAIKTCKLGDTEDEVLLNGRYAIEYIKRDIKSADKIIDINAFDGLDEEYKDNIGFVIMRYDPDIKEKYSFSTYYLKDNKIYRIVANREEEKYPKEGHFKGHNEIAEFITSIEDTRIHFDSMLIELSFILKGEYGKETKFNTKLSIRCPVVY